MPANIHVKVNEVDVGHLTAEKGSYLFGYNKESVHVERHCHPDIYSSPEKYCPKKCYLGNSF